jgi:hypothetical protein
MSATYARICIYGFDPGSPDTQLTVALASHLTATPLWFRSLDDLLIHLKSPATTADIIVLAPGDAVELAGLLTHKRLQDRRLVLVLPDTEEATLSQAHLLGPRYLCFDDSTGTDLAAVLNKMMANTPERPTWEGAVG